MSTRNELLKEILTATQAGLNLKIERVTNEEYLNESPTVGTEYDTGYNPKPVTETTTEISIVALIAANGSVYSLFSRLSATAAIANPDIKVGKLSEFPGVAGDAEMVFWFDSGTQSIHIETDFDGGGKTLVALQVVSAFDRIV